MKQIILSTIFTLLLVHPFIHTCVIDITNDLDKDVLLVSHSGEKAAIIRAGEKGKFGSKVKRPHFYLLEASDNLTFEYVKTIQQIACSPTKDDISVTISELLSETPNEIISALFAVKRDRLFGKIIMEEEDEDQTYSH